MTGYFATPAALGLLYMLLSLKLALHGLLVRLPIIGVCVPPLHTSFSLRYLFLDLSLHCHSFCSLKACFPAFSLSTNNVRREGLSDGSKPVFSSTPFPLLSTRTSAPSTLLSPSFLSSSHNLFCYSSINNIHREG